MKASERDQILRTLNDRFEQNVHRHKGHTWDEVRARLEASPTALRSLREMELSGGEPDVIGCDRITGRFLYCDCSPESPSGRRSLCFDRDARMSRKENQPKGSAMEVAAAMGIELLSEQQYRQLQEIGEFDMKTSSWVATPADIRSRGGALFCDRRYGQVFVYHNGAQSWFAARGFRGLVHV